MYIVFLYIYSAPQNVNGSSTEMTTASETKRKKQKQKTMVLFFDYSQVGNWLYIMTYNMTTAIILWQRLLWK